MLVCLCLLSCEWMTGELFQEVGSSSHHHHHTYPWTTKPCFHIRKGIHKFLTFHWCSTSPEIFFLCPVKMHSLLHYSKRDGGFSSGFLGTKKLLKFTTEDMKISICNWTHGNQIIASFKGENILLERARNDACSEIRNKKRWGKIISFSGWCYICWRWWPHSPKFIILFLLQKQKFLYHQHRWALSEVLLFFYSSW